MGYPKKLGRGYLSGLDRVLVSAGSSTSPTLSFSSTPTAGFFDSGGNISVVIGGGIPMTWTSTYATVGNGIYFITTGGVYRQGTLTGASINTNQDNYDPGITTAHYKLRLTLGASVNITGLVGGGDGRELLIVNTSASFTATLKHDVTSTAANRFYTPNAADFAIRPKGAARIHWDEVSSRWQVVSP
jgi:hypothetical protein